MTVRFSSIPTVVVLFNAVFGCQTPPWTLKRVDPGSSAVSFFNNTVVDSFTLTRWTWTDSSGGFWDTRLKLTTLNKDALIGGGFSYFDRNANELTSVRWFKTKMNGTIRWKYGSAGSPPDSWWMTAVVPTGNISWGFKHQISDGSWLFRVGNETLEPNNVQIVNGWLHGTVTRRKRSFASQENDVESLRTKQDGSVRINGDPDEEDYADVPDTGDIFQTIIVLPYYECAVFVYRPFWDGDHVCTVFGCNHRFKPEVPRRVYSDLRAVRVIENENWSIFQGISRSSKTRRRQNISGSRVANSVQLDKHEQNL